MKNKITTALLFILLFFNHIQSLSTENLQVTDSIQLIHVTDSIFIHESQSYSSEYNVSFGSNGLLVIKNGKAIIIDTPISPKKTSTLLKYITDNMKLEPVLFIGTHWHDDCIGGVKVIKEKGIKTLYSKETYSICKEKGLPLADFTFDDFKTIKTTGMELSCYYPGEGHSSDNIVVYIATSKVLFGGCLIKNLNSRSPGNLSAATPKEWPKSVQNVIQRFPDIEFAIPGHGQHGDKSLLTHTIKILKSYNTNYNELNN